MSYMLSSWQLSATLRPALSSMAVGIFLLVGCDVPRSGPVSHAAGDKVNVTSTRADVATRKAPDSAAELPPSAEKEGAKALAAAEPSTTPPAELESASAAAADPDAGKVAADRREEKPARVFSSSRAPARPGEAEKISFDDLVIGLQADVVFRPWMMGDRPKELDGKKVRLSGFMHAGAEPVKTKEFVLLRNLECKFGPGGQADHLAQVYMKPGVTTHYPGKDPIKVEGRLKIQPFEGTDGNTWSLYRIEDAEVVR